MTDNLRVNAKRLRKEHTPWETKLWAYLRAGKFSNKKFKRQVIIGDYIVDFCCYEKKLIIELDGSQHLSVNAVKRDSIRDMFLVRRGYKVLRFYNNDIDTNLNGVLEVIFSELL